MGASGRRRKAAWDAAFGYARKPPGGPFAALGLASRAHRQLDQAGAEVYLQLLVNGPQLDSRPWAQPAQIYAPGALQLIDAGTVPTHLIDLAQLAYAGAEVRLQLLASEVQRDRVHELGTWPGVKVQR